MSKPTAEIIAAYVARVDEIQKRTHNELEADELKAIARELGFALVRSGPLVRSSYHAAT